MVRVCAGDLFGVRCSLPLPYRSVEAPPPLERLQSLPEAVIHRLSLTFGEILRIISQSELISR